MDTSQTNPVTNIAAMSTEDSTMTPDLILPKLADEGALGRVAPNDAPQSANSNPTTSVNIRLKMLLAALGCVAFGWLLVRYGGFSSTFLWLGGLMGVLMYGLSFVPEGYDGWMLRRPLLFAPYAATSARRNWVVSLGLLATIFGTWVYAGDGISDNTSANAGQNIAQTAARAAIAVEAPQHDSASLKIIGKEGPGPGELREPRGVAIGRDGRIYVADSANKRVQIFAPDGRFLIEILGDEEAFEFPGAVAINSKNELLVLDSNKQWIYYFNADGRPIRRVGGPPMAFYFPRGLGVDFADNVYIADTGGSRIVKLSPNGERLQVFGRRGTGKGEIMEPTAVVVDAEGIIYVADPTNRRLSVFNAGGDFLRDFPIRAASTVDGPKLAIEPEGTILVTSPGSHVIHRYDKNTGIVAEFSGEGGAPGRLRIPTGIAVFEKTVWIAETAGHRVQQLELK